MNLPLGVCLTGLIAELGIPTNAHHHDFFWERERYQTNRILDLLDTVFPADGPAPLPFIIAQILWTISIAQTKVIEKILLWKRSAKLSLIKSFFAVARRGYG